MECLAAIPRSIATPSYSSAPAQGELVLVKRAHHAHVAHDRQASAKAQAPHDDIRLPIVARPDARDQFTDERVLLRVDAGFRPQRAESALESSP